jgi:hypothetical protein
MVSRESLVTIETNRYSVPVRLIGQALTARLHAERIALYQGAELVASHRRHRGRGARIVIPEHYEPVFALKPRARTMLYRDWLVGLAVPVAEYVGELCRKRYDEMESQHPLRGYPGALCAGAGGGNGGVPRSRRACPGEGGGRRGICALLPRSAASAPAVASDGRRAARDPETVAAAA